MRYPEFLQPGGRIGFIAPSFGATTEPYKSLFTNTLCRFNGKGYRTIVGDNCYESCGIGKSNSAQACGAEINDFFINDRADVIISCGGGETMCEDLPYVDFEKIASAKPRWYMGYSDNTNLTFTLPTLCDTAAIYAPCAGDFGTEPLHESLRDAFHVLTGEKLTVSNYELWEKSKLGDPDKPLAPYNVSEPFSMKIFNGREPADGAFFEGRLLGGCLDCLVTLVGTRFDKVREFNSRYNKDGIIWFLEACDLNPMSLRRAVWQLDNAGWFENAKAFMIGRSLHFGEEQMGMDMYEAYLGVLGRYKVPILMDLDIGHLSPMMPVISGARAKVSAGSNTVMMRYNLK